MSYSSFSGWGATSNMIPATTIRWSSNYYKINSKTAGFQRYGISVNGAAWAGTKFVALDVDGDSDIDIRDRRKDRSPSL